MNFIKLYYDIACQVKNAQNWTAGSRDHFILHQQNDSDCVTFILTYCDYLSRRKTMFKFENVQVCMLQNYST